MSDVKIYLGIDPGKDGGIAAIEGAYSGVIMAIKTPTTADNELDITAIVGHLHNLMELGTVYATIEKVHSMPGQGVASMFSFGMTTGILHGIIGTLGLPRFLVAPQTWKKRILHDTPKDKDAAIAYCTMAYPYVSMVATPRSTKPHNGIADAICIARYAYEVDIHER